MKTIESIKKALITAGPGTIVSIRGYKNSSGETRDIRVRLLDHETYWSMQREDLRILREADEADLLGDTAGDLAAADILTARDQMISAKSSSLGNYQTGVVEKRGPFYENIGGSLGRLPENGDAIYLQRLLFLGEVEDPKPAKGAIPRAKQYLTSKLDLPSRRYVHSLKFEDGKFEELTVEQIVEGSALPHNS